MGRLLFVVVFAISILGVTFASQTPSAPESIIGFTEDQVKELFGAPSTREKSADGTEMLYYDHTSVGTVTFYVKSGKVVRTTPERLPPEFSRKAGKELSGQNLISRDIWVDVDRRVIGMSYSQVQRLLGEPRAVENPPTGVVVWRYQAPGDRELVLHLKLGEVTSAGFQAPQTPSRVSTPSRQASPPTPKALRLQAQYYVQRADHVKAIELLDQCLALKPNDKDCARRRAEVSSAYASALYQKYRELPTTRLMGRFELLTRLLGVSPESAARAELTAVTAQLEEARTKSQEFIAGLHRSASADQVAEMVVQQFPAELAVFDDVPEVAVAKREARLHEELATAQAAAKRGEYRQAFSTLAALPSDAEVSTVHERLVALATAQFDSQFQRAAASRSFDELEAALGRLIALDGAFSAADLQQRRSAVLLAAADILKQQASTAGRPADVVMLRVLREFNVKQAPRILNSSDFPWDQAATSNRSFDVAIKRSNQDAGCAQLDTAQLRNQATKALPFPFFVVSDASTGAVLEFADLECEEDNRIGQEEALNSTYIASYQQITNPVYVQLQTELAVAQQKLAEVKAENLINPPSNIFAGVAAGLAEGSAQNTVNRLVARLRETPPFLSEPVRLPYTAQRFTVLSSARVRFNLTIADPTNGFRDSIHVSGTGKVSASGVRGAMPNDSSGLINKEPAPADETALIRQAVTQLDSEHQTAVRTLVERLLLERAKRLQPTKTNVVPALGYLLLAKDVAAAPTDSSQSPYDGFVEKALGGTIADLSKLDLDRKLFGVSPTAAPANVSAGKSEVAAARSRTSMIQRALDAVVTVKVGQSTGSGFFVSEDGLVLTNAHVVENTSTTAATITVITRKGERFLGKIVKLAASADLALLRVSGRFDTVLPLAGLESVEVGADVVAVGSPLGLQGTVTRGIVSAVRTVAGLKLLQTDTPINPGNSGGPLLTEDGRVVGINTSKLTERGIESIGFAVASDEARAAFSGLLNP
jgi:hypothetical protein